MRFLCPRLFALLADVLVRLPKKQFADLTGTSSEIFFLSEALKIGCVRDTIKYLFEDHPDICPCPGEMEAFYGVTGQGMSQTRNCHSLRLFTFLHSAALGRRPYIPNPSLTLLCDRWPRGL